MKTLGTFSRVHAPHTIGGTQVANPGVVAYTDLANTFGQLQNFTGGVQANGVSLILPTGCVFGYIGTTAPAGFVLGFGTIGNAGSGATNRANADTSALFTLLWNSWADAQAPVSTGRGGSAAADFAANKTIAVPDMRGRALAGLDNMGGSAANRLTGTVMSPNGNTIGAVGGLQTHTLSTPELASHVHVIQRRINNTGFGTTKVTAGELASGSDGTHNSDAAGGGAAHNNTQPTLIMPFIVKL